MAQCCRGNQTIEEALELSLINVKLTLVDYLKRIIFYKYEE